MRRAWIPVIVALLVLPAPAAPALPRGTKVETYKSGLAFPVDMAWVQGTKKIFFTEKNSGRIRVMAGRRLLDRPCVDLAVTSDGERGALGIALHPRFKKNHHLYVYYTNSSPLDNRVTRFTVTNNRCRNANHIVTGIQTTSGYHNGGQIEFVRGKLFIATGESHQPAEAQSTTNRLGKILRVNPTEACRTTTPSGPRTRCGATGIATPSGSPTSPARARSTPARTDRSATTS